MLLDGPSSTQCNKDSDNIRLFVELLNTEHPLSESGEGTLTLPPPPLFEEALSLPKSLPQSPDSEESLSVGNDGSDYKPNRSVKKTASRSAYLICSKITLEQGPSKLADLKKEITDLETEKASTKNKYKLKTINAKLERRQYSLFRLQNHLKSLQDKAPAAVEAQPSTPAVSPLVQENTQLQRELCILKKFVSDQANLTENTEKEIEQLRLTNKTLTEQLSKSETQLKDSQRTPQSVHQECQVERERLLDKIHRWARAYDELEDLLYYERRAHQDQVVHLENTVDDLQLELFAQRTPPMLRQRHQHRTADQPRPQENCQRFDKPAKPR
ncbi:MAG: hypothetical protein JSR17_04230 [Proteobacteria bacterium]|nr:hypothetical protein [Pseudomonadota bacterium]